MVVFYSFILFCVDTWVCYNLCRLLCDNISHNALNRTGYFFLIFLFSTLNFGTMVMELKQKKNNFVTVKKTFKAIRIENGKSIFLPPDVYCVCLREYWVLNSFSYIFFMLTISIRLLFCFIKMLYTKVVLRKTAAGEKKAKSGKLLTFNRELGFAIENTVDFRTFTANILLLMMIIECNDIECDSEIKLI